MRGTRGGGACGQLLRGNHRHGVVAINALSANRRTAGMETDEQGIFELLINDVQHVTLTCLIFTLFQPGVVARARLETSGSGSGECFHLMLRTRFSHTRTHGWGTRPDRLGQPGVASR